ncbi:Alpha/Beta hydrolase protein [Flagelloscypha sp. PMI_526]|nr:Alpha/Beta hydrolase protein [Flagelloscypha sp. PMI_526]
MLIGYSLTLNFYPEFTIRLAHATSSSEPCFPGSLEYSGYVDTSDGKHLFFRKVISSRGQPEQSPLVLWMNGGPGSSSAHGYMYEIGPCNIASPTTTAYNPFSWTEVANVMFLDQPAGVGYSYADSGTDIVGTSEAAAQDCYHLLQSFFTAFPKYANLPLHLVGESYGGHYVPHLASLIYLQNNARKSKHINLSSVIFINALLDPLIQLESSVDFVCDSARPILDPTGPECTSLRAFIPKGTALFKACYADELQCIAAGKFLLEEWGYALTQLPHNPADWTKPCDHSRGACYEQATWTEEYLNLPHIKARLGVDLDVRFSLGNGTVAQAYLESGDAGKRTAGLLEELIDEGGVRVLVVNGDRDTLCNHIGSEKMVEGIQSHFQHEFNRTLKRPWFTHNGSLAGSVRSAGHELSAGNVTFVRVYGAGYVGPFDLASICAQKLQPQSSI